MMMEQETSRRRCWARSFVFCWHVCSHLRSCRWWCCWWRCCPPPTLFLPCSAPLTTVDFAAAVLPWATPATRQELSQQSCKFRFHCVLLLAGRRLVLGQTELERAPQFLSLFIIGHKWHAAWSWANSPEATASWHFNRIILIEIHLGPN